MCRSSELLVFFGLLWLRFVVLMCGLHIFSLASNASDPRVHHAWPSRRGRRTKSSIPYVVLRDRLHRSNLGSHGEQIAASFFPCSANIGHDKILAENLAENTTNTAQGAPSLHHLTHRTVILDCSAVHANRMFECI